MYLKVEEMVKGSGGEIVQHGAKGVVESITIDARDLKAGALFVAIKGAHHDGHSFLEEALAKDAMGVVIQRDDALSAVKEGDLAEGKWIIKVEDTTKALGDIAKTYRSHFDIPIVAITGSNGKSTTKEMVASIASLKGETLKTEGNFNNLIGLPLTVFRLERQHKVAILEMGMNAKGEIARLTEIANPTVGIITNVNAAHLEQLHTIENVARAKGELFETMSKNSVAIINNDDPLVRQMGEKFTGKKIKYGTSNDSDIRFARMKSVDLESIDLVFYAHGKEYQTHLPVPGMHNMMNALAAMAVAEAIGVPLKKAVGQIEKFTPMKMRMERVQLANGVQLINDSYNANPNSMMAALKTVSGAKRAGRFIAVLGDMFELGPEATLRHRELGGRAKEFGVDRLFAFGGHSGDVVEGALSAGLAQSAISNVSTIEELSEKVAKEIKIGDIVLVKGSRGMKMERVVEYLKNEFGV